MAANAASQNSLYRSTPILVTPYGPLVHAKRSWIAVLRKNRCLFSSFKRNNTPVVLIKSSSTNGVISSERGSLSATVNSLTHTISQIKFPGKGRIRMRTSALTSKSVRKGRQHVTVYPMGGFPSAGSAITSGASSEPNTLCKASTIWRLPS